MVAYENVLADPIGSMARILKFAGFRGIDNDDLARAVVAHPPKPESFLSSVRNFFWPSEVADMAGELLISKTLLEKLGYAHTVQQMLLGAEAKISNEHSWNDLGL